MSEQMYQELALERAIAERFGSGIDLHKVIALRIPISHTADATIFLTAKKQLFVYIQGQSKFVLGDIQKLVARIGLKPERFVPPKNRPNYFDEIGRVKFKQVFPGRSHVNDGDIMFYKTLAPYNPALVQISEVKHGEIYQFDSDSSGNWRVSVKFAYRRIRTS